MSLSKCSHLSEVKKMILCSVRYSLLFLSLLVLLLSQLSGAFLPVQTQWQLRTKILLSHRTIIRHNRPSLVICRKQNTPYLSDSPTPYFPDEDDIVDRSLDIAVESNEQRTGANIDKNRQQQSNLEIKSFREALDEFGRSLKSRAIKANAIASLVKKPSSTSKSSNKGATLLYITKKCMYLFQSCLFYVGYLLYRGYRGLFVIVPEVFRVTFKKLESTIEESPFASDDDEDESDNSSLGSVSTRNAVSSSKASEMDKGKRWRTRVTVSLLSGIIMTSYVLGGALRVLSRIIMTLRSSKGDVSQSFAAGVEEQEKNEKVLFSKFSLQNPRDSPTLAAETGPQNYPNNDDTSSTAPIVNGTI